MEIAQLHRWDIGPEEAIWIQEWLRGRVVMDTPAEEVHYVAGCDVSSTPGSETDLIHGSVCVYTWPGIEYVETGSATMIAPMEYQPGLLAYREVPVLLEALGRLSTTPNLLVVDAHGMCHPRRFGAASHLGVIMGMRSIGIAKSYLCGTVKGTSVMMDPLVVEWSSSTRDIVEELGLDIDTTTREYPAEVARKYAGKYISIGHMISLDDAVSAIIHIYRTNGEFMGAAHHAANECRRGYVDND